MTDSLIIKPKKATGLFNPGPEGEYLDALEAVAWEGKVRTDRTGVGTIGLFNSYSIIADLELGFPLLTTKRVPFKAVLTELLWFLRGDTNIKYLHEHGCHIWDGNAREDGEVGPMYGKQWTDWVAADGTHVNQIANLIEGLRNDPFSRRHVVSSWNAGELKDMCLSPCHGFMQFYSESPDKEGDKRILHVSMYQRSCDMFLGVPFNIASYAILLGMVAQQTNHAVGKVHWIGGDMHIYSNHVDQVNEQLSREPRSLPTLEIKPAKDIFSYTHDNFVLTNYDPHPTIKAEMAV